MTAPSPTTLYDADTVWSWDPCFERDQIDALLPEPVTALDMLTKTGGAWDSLEPEHRFWAVLRDGVLPDGLMRLFACWCAEQVLHIYEDAYPNDDRPRKAIEAARGFVNGTVSGEEWAAARAAARDAAWAAAWAAARAAQITKLTDMVRIWTETGDVMGGEGGGA